MIRGKRRKVKIIKVGVGLVVVKSGPDNNITGINRGT